MAAVIFSGCSKDDDKDTPDPITDLQRIIDCQNLAMEETYQNISGIKTHYLRGGEKTSSVNMGALRIKFNAGTGNHTVVNGTNYKLTWTFSSADETTFHISMKEQNVHRFL